MADFVGALKKTLDGLGNPTPEIRARVYDKARSTIADKLAKNIPPLAPSVVAQHKRTLEDAIAIVERGYAKPAPVSDPLSELEDIFSSIDRNKNQPSHVRQPAKAEPAWQPAKTAPEWQPAPAAKASLNWQKPPPEGTDAEPSDADLPAAYENSDSFRDDVFPNDEEPAPSTFQRQHPAERRRSYGGLIAAVIALLVIAGGGYGIWLNKDAFSNMLGLNSTTVATVEPLVKPSPAERPAADAAARAPAAAAPADAEGTKFTQRLTPEGGEVDPGPASGQGGIGEGESVAALTTPPPAAPAPAAPAGDPPATTVPATPGAAPATPPADGAPPAPAAPTDSAAAPAAPALGAAPGAAPTAAPAETALAVGQKAIFYEERTSTAQGSAEPGSIVWSLVQESPGGNLPPEPAIRAEASIPGKDVQLRMTIRRNTDQTLPASHIIEMIFLTPDGFDGGGVDNILRVAMKGSEQDAGSPLIGIPAKIADGFFLVALNDTKADEDANLTLLRGQKWIDVPVVYKTGRRALLTMEKGIPGEKVFDEALKAWQTKEAG
ncbi:hypothetical protein [Mesorhizobium sp.]|uniref:hypothetical protein n=1 Tax=Mesorhizobium sp. TaxID=1871066 RepID=UPI000FE95651|nr:hypothetical protein [Mesorhizobium sp.]RWP07260.1 MAG: hypothetical protein EOQ99_07235 [Mesorhizobium sp.]RWP16917.1 MAG: hypothetical protein EOR00_15345 [Mesorhizobium sp.]TIL35153.1 MAG: hypothetical protein E5Y82_23575 [Mesorhizobium sp.]TIM48291.1 MAG: hypothetical protein E5Y55_05755 [Mesorhizobium sp.]